MRYLTVVVVAFAVASSAAARNYAGTVELQPTPTVGVASMVTGCGYIPDEPITIKYLWSATGGKRELWTMVKVTVLADAAGCFVDTFVPAAAGFYQVYLTQQNQHSRQDIDMAVGFAEFVV